MTEEKINILLTGGTGFFGRSFLRHWIKNKAYANRPQSEVTVLTRNPDSFRQHHPEFVGLPWLHFHQGDISVYESLPHGQQFSHILHAAADSTNGPALQPLQRFDQIVDGTRLMLDFALACKASRFLLASSGGVYGPQPQDVDAIEESWNGMPDPLNPANAYGVAKRAAEHLCAIYQQSTGLECVIARCFAFIGPDLPLDVHFAIGNFIRDALHGDRIVINGDGTQVRSYMAQQDLASWLEVLLIRGRAGQAYNVGSDQPITILELAHLVQRLLSPEKQVEVMAKSDANSGRRNLYVPSIAKAKNSLNLRLSVSLEDAILETAAANN